MYVILLQIKCSVLKKQLMTTISSHILHDETRKYNAYLF